MNNCLVTKLKTAINNDSVEKIGEIVLSVKAISAEQYDSSPDSSTIQFRVSAPVTAYVVGDGGGIQTDRSKIDTDPLQSIDFEASANAQYIYLKNGTYELHLTNKYAFTFINLKGNASIPNISSINDISKLAYSEGLTNLNVQYGDTSGDIGKLSRIAEVLTGCYLTNSDVTGDISEFAFTEGNIGGTLIYGDFTNILKNNTSNSVFKGSAEHPKRDGELTADISQANANTAFLSAQSLNQKIACRWGTTRSSASKIIAFKRGLNADDGFDFGNALDAMLINQANCTAVSGATGDDATIDVLGNRTSASDSAVAALKTMGYTIKVNGVTL